MASEVECNLFMKSLKMSPVIEAIEKHPAIWNTFATEYKERKKLEQAWSSICKQFIPGWEDMPELLRSKYLSEMKKKWANVRDYYRRDLLQKIDNKRTRYVYFDLLSFLKPIYLEEKMNDDGEVSDEELAAYEDEYLGEIFEEQSVVSVKTEAQDPIETPSTSDVTVDYVSQKTRSKEFKGSPSMKRQRVDDEDDDLTFFRCLLPDIKKLSYQQKFDFKLGTMKLLKKIQNGNFTNDTSSD